MKMSRLLITKKKKKEKASPNIELKIWVEKWYRLSAVPFFMFFLVDGLYHSTP
jgi:hypothetical protein